MTLTVIIPTYNRAECIRENLKRLADQRPPPEQIIVVDASPDDLTRHVAEESSGVTYLRNPSGRGNTPNSRNLALLHATSEILAFLDDDAFVHPGWAASLRETYANPVVAGVAGRALNGQPGEEKQGVDEIGRFLPDGRLTGNFAADPGRIVEVDHMIGCNMSLRASVVGELGGFRDDMRPGPFGICEETEICIRARRLGYRFFFNPAVCADHVGASQPGGKRFSPKYSYYHLKNNIVMVLRNYGPGAFAGRHILAMSGQMIGAFIRKIGGAFAHLAYGVAGLITGLGAGLFWLSRTGLDPARKDAGGQAIRDQLRLAQPPKAANESRPSAVTISGAPQQTTSPNDPSRNALR